jgi:hypothetical protein
MASFDFKRVSVIVDGFYVTGWMDGTVISAVKNTDNAIPHTGAAGETTYSESNDNTGMITVTVKQDSPFVAKAIALATGKREFATQVVDQNDGAKRAGGNKCRIIKTPDVNWGSEIAGVEIQIHVSDYTITAA